MRTVEFSPLAEQDLKSIRDYIALDNPPAAEKLLNRIESVIEKLAEWPGIGHHRKDVINPDYLFFSVRPYVLAYHFNDSRITIVRILHGARDIRKILDNKSGAV